MPQREALGRTALERFDMVLARQPQTDGETFSAATKALATFREALIAEQARPPSPAERLRLDHLNAVLSLLLAGHFPLGEVPWDDIAAARAWLAQIVEAFPVVG